MKSLDDRVGSVPFGLRSEGLNQPSDYQADSRENDGKLFEVQVGDPVPPSNLPPVVNAGADFLTTTGTNVALQGVVTDDGLPSGAAVTQLWSVDPSSPLTDVTFVDPVVPSTGATFGTPGTYVLLLTADDTEFTRRHVHYQTPMRENRFTE